MKYLVGFLLLFIVSVYGFAEENKAEVLCNLEIEKDEFDIGLVHEYCSQSADYYFDNKNYESASWYNLLGARIDENINLVENYIDEKDSFVIYPNIGHCYVLKDNFDKANKFYVKYISKQLQPNIDIQEDYKLLYKLYPQKKKSLDKGLKNWNRLYSPLLGMEKYYDKYKKYEENENYLKAIESLEKIISLRKNYSIIDNENISTDYTNLSLLYSAIADYPKALKLSIKALNIDKEIFGINYHSTAISYSNLGVLYEKISDYKKAEQNHLQALKILKNLYGEEDKSVAITYNNLGVLYSSIGKYRESLKFYKKTLNIDKRLKENASNIINTYNNIGELYSVLGNYPKALKYYSQALQLNISLHGVNHSDTGFSYNNIGQIYEFLEDFERSEDFYKKALKIFKYKLGKSHPLIANTFSNLGNLYYTMGENTKSLEKHKEALKMREDIYKKKEHIDMAISYNALGLLYYDDGNYSASLNYYTRTLEIGTRLLGEDNIAHAPTYGSLGTLYKKLGDKNKALYFYKKALKLEERILGKQHSNLAVTYNSLSLLYFSERKNKKAYEYIKKAFKIFIMNINQNFTILDSKQKENYLKEHAYKFSNLLYLTSLAKEDVIFTINSWLRYKGTIFDSENILSMLDSNNEVTEEVKRNIEMLRKLPIELEHIYKLYIKDKNRIKYINSKKEIEDKIHTIQVKLSEKNYYFKELLELQFTDYKEISKILRANQLYIDFIRAKDRYYLFSLDSKNNASFKKLNLKTTKRIDRAINKFIEYNKKIAKNINNIKLINRLEPLSKELLSDIYRDLIESSLKNKKFGSLIISPDGLLNLLPFEALYHKGRYLIEDYQIAYISSGRELIRQSKQEKIKNYKRKMISFGNPNFNLSLPLEKNIIRSETKGFGGKNQGQVVETWEQAQNFLPIGNEELVDILKLYPNALIYENENATVKNLMNVDSSQILHISTHGKFLSNNSTQNPMLNSGLAFAGANDKNNSLRGIATALQLSALDLKDTELVVLSACESGLGKVQKAEGVKGLAKAFLQAGARNVIMSLWSVSTQKTAILMKKFYTNVQAKQDYATALQNAKLDMIKEHPYYWSAFIMHGI